ncbi:MAG: hypothetical protein U1F50_15990 [Rubrivivax sp.]
MRNRLLAQRLLALAAAAAVLFGSAALWRGHSLALFAAWALVIAVLAWLMERGAPDE